MREDKGKKERKVENKEKRRGKGKIRKK